MLSSSFFFKRRGTTLAGIFSTAFVTTVLLCGAGSVPVENFSPQGSMQADLNAGGHSITNAATVSTTNLVVNGMSFTGAGATYTLPAATTSTLGGVKQGTNIIIAGDGTISSAAGSANVAGIRKSSGAGSTDVAATQSDVTGLLGGLYPLVSNNLSDLANSLIGARNLGVPGSSVISESASFAAATRGALYNVTTGTSAITVTLPAAANGFYFVVRKADNSTGTISINGSTLGVMGHTIEVYCDGTTFINRYVGGAIDSSGNFTYTLPLNANYNIIPSGTGHAQVGGLPLLPLDNSGNLPLDAHTINLDSRTIVIDGSSVDNGHLLASPYSQNWFYQWLQMPYANGHCKQIMTTATGSSGASTITVASTAGLAPGQVISGNASIPAGAQIGSITGNVITYDSREATLTNSAAVIGNVTFNTVYNFAVSSSGIGSNGTGSTAYLNTTTGTVSNSLYARYWMANGLRLHRPTANGGDGGVSPILIWTFDPVFNDLAAGRSVANCINDLGNLSTQAISDGFTVYLVTSLTTNGISTAYEQNIDTVNNQAGIAIPCYRVIDLSMIAPLSSDATAFQSDRLHPLATTCTFMANQAEMDFIADGSNYSRQPGVFRNGTFVGLFNALVAATTQGGLTATYSGTGVPLTTSTSGSQLQELEYTSTRTGVQPFSVINAGTGDSPGQGDWGMDALLTGKIFYFNAFSGLFNNTGGSFAADTVGAGFQIKEGTSSTTSSCTFSSSSPAVSLGAYNAAIQPGAVVTGTGIQTSPPTTVLAYPTGSTLTLSQNPAAAGTAITLTFTNYGKQGTATLVNGTVTVTCGAVAASSKIQLTGGALNSSTAVGALDCPTINPGASFVITSYVPGGTTTQTGDQRTVSYDIFDPAP